MNTYVIGFFVIILGVLAGWFVLGGKVPQSLQQKIQPKTKEEVAPQATAPSSLYEYREEKVSGTPQTTPGATKGGVIETTPKPVTYASVLFSDAGFTQSVSTVKVGTTVTFTNDSSKSLWVASAPHPIHDLLPGFDQLKSVGKGGTYQYTFTKVGTWKYHNHVAPEYTGTIIVSQ